MSPDGECLRLIQDVREAADDPHAAYLIRSRLRRAILVCARMVARNYGARTPDIPGVFVAPAGSSDLDREIVSLCGRIHAIARDLCQPSESFDVRWEAGWSELEGELNQLQSAVASRNG
jgi:hypothetical protein